MVSGEEESIEAAALARRERLRALKAAQELLNTPDEDDNALSADPSKHDNNQLPQEQKEHENDEDDEEENVNMTVKFRNYLPHDKQLQEGKVAPPVLPKFEDPALASPPEEKKKEDPFLNIAPKKPNWDLRRDVQKKLDKLERRTQKAMLVLMEREEANRRLVEEGENGED